MAEEDEGPKFNKANIDDEFLRHPHSGAFIRNPLLDKSQSLPIIFQADEFTHNCLDDALVDYHCVTVSESAFKAMTLPRPGSMDEAEGEVTMKPQTGLMSKSASGTSLRSTLARAALGRLHQVPSGYEFVITLRKSTYVPPKSARRRNAEPRTMNGTLVDKLNIELSDMGGKALKVENVNEGLVTTWNRANLGFQVRPMDYIIKVNSARKSADMLEELIQVNPDNVKITIRRPPPEVNRGLSKLSNFSGAQ